MKIIHNTGNERVLDLARTGIKQGGELDIVSQAFSLFAFNDLQQDLFRVEKARLVLPPEGVDLGLLGDDVDRSNRNHLQARWLAARCAEWLNTKVEVRRTKSSIPQGALVLRDGESRSEQVFFGAFAFTTDGLGTTPGNPLSLIQATETSIEANQLSQWFDALWDQLSADTTVQREFENKLRDLSAIQPLFTLYSLILQQLFGGDGRALDEDQVVKAATGIRDTVVWKKLYKFQRDGVVGAIDKLNRLGGCIIADSVGLGKTFEALAIIKYHELRNDRVLVLCPKRLRDNWTLYTANDRRNVLASDRFNYDVLNHTDLSREGGLSGDLDLAHVNWGNYDLVVIDESHNFRNKGTPKQGGETRYDRLMRRIIQEGVRTRVLMLSATPVNNRLADLRNQIVFATEGNDAALRGEGISSIDATTRLAQKQFNRWLDLDDIRRTPAKLVEMLGFDYFKLLDELTIARSRRHIEKYYGTSETGRFPDRLKPINIKADVDLGGEFRQIREINDDIRRLHLASYTPLRYVLPSRQSAYDAKYNTEVTGGKGVFRQLDREESLIHLLRVNVLKRMESSVFSFALTLERQLLDVESILTRINTHSEDMDEIDIGDIDVDDPAFESLLVGRKVKVLLDDVDLIRWKQDLTDDRQRLAALHEEAKRVIPSRDAKLAALRTVIYDKCSLPINANNRKIIVFTAFADTAKYLYDNLAPWAKTHLGVETALVTGSGGNQTTIHGLRRDLGTILSTFSPRSKERPDEYDSEGEIDLLFATDCISEGQNLQDCDWLVNYDIHWNPVRIIQRFGRIDRLGSHNDRIQLVNFWPNMELDEYINLEQRVSGRMVLLDVSATGEENLIVQEAGNPMNDLEYRRKQLLRMQETVVDLEDLSAGVSIADLTLTDFRIDLAEFQRDRPGVLDKLPLGASSVCTTADIDLPPGVTFLLRAAGDRTKDVFGPGYPLAPHGLVHVADDGSIVLGHLHAKEILDRLKHACVGHNDVDIIAMNLFDRITHGGKDMRSAQDLLAKAVRSVVGKGEERAVESLFKQGGTHALAGEFAGINDFEVVAFLSVVPEDLP